MINKLRLALAIIIAVAMAPALGALVSALAIPTHPFKVYVKSNTVTLPTVAVEIDNNASTFNQILAEFEDIIIEYSPITHQVFLFNTSLNTTYQLEYTFLGNNQYMGVIPYTSVPDGEIYSEPIQFTGNGIYYLTYSGLANSKFNIDTPNAKFIAQDLTIMSTTATLTCDLNNQNLVTANQNINRILMSCSILTPPTLSHGGIEH